jgi:hypothetical protein
MYQKACKILNVKIGSGQDEIKKSFRKLAVEYHPDVSNKPNTSKFIEINRAYKYLSDPDAYLRFINRHRVVREMKKRPHAYESTIEESKAYKKQKEESLPEMPPIIALFASFLERFYDYVFIMTGLFMIISPPLLFIFDDEIEIKDTGILPIIIPILTGIAFLTGVFIYMLRDQHPFALKLQSLYYRFVRKK